MIMSTLYENLIDMLKWFMTTPLEGVRAAIRCTGPLCYDGSAQPLYQYPLELVYLYEYLR